MADVSILTDFLKGGLASTSVVDFDNAKQRLIDGLGNRLAPVPVGGRSNNKGIIEVGNDPGRCLIERVTNASDAVLEFQFVQHNGIPKCNSPRDAAHSWLGVPIHGLSSLSPAQRRAMARSVIVTVEPGTGKEGRIVSVRDSGIGLSSDEVPNTILSLNESNKITKRYLAGTYGQGGSSTFAVSERTLIVSRKHQGDDLCFTFVEYVEGPEDLVKVGNYVYWTLDGGIPTLAAERVNFEPGTLVRHLGFDLSHYSGAFDPASVYGLLNRFLFDPIMPITLQNRVNQWNRTIKGSRNSLNGAVDEGDSAKADIEYSVPLFNVSLGDLGSVGLEYWLLKAPESGSKNPIRAYVDHNKPFVLTHNGQNQGEISQRLLKKDVAFPYLAGRFICHVNCDNLTALAKRKLLTSTREQMRVGQVYDVIVSQLIQSLTSDEELERANNVAREASLRNTDDAHEKELRREVSRLLRLQGISIGETIGGRGGADGPASSSPPRPAPPRPPQPIPILEPPTFVSILASDGAIKFYPGQRRYIRLTTNANSTYHDFADLSKSKFNFILGSLKLSGTTPLANGRMRMIVDCEPNAVVGGTGVIRVELLRKGLPILVAEHPYEIVTKPATQARRQTSNVPNFEVIPVDDQQDSNWSLFPEEIAATDIASFAQMDSGTLMIYYSRIFPKFATELRALEVKDQTLAKTFQKRYEIWLAVHSLIYYQDQQDREDSFNFDDEIIVKLEHKERSRIAVVAALMAKKEINDGALPDSDEM